MLLGALFDNPTLKGAELEVTGLTADSRAVAPGMVFAALAGSKADGTAFVTDAVAGGAIAIIADAAARLPNSADAVAVLRDENPRRLLALSAAKLHAPQPATLVAVTGTNGKTSVTQFLRQIWTAAGTPSAVLGTMGVFAPFEVPYPGLTTPDPVSLHKTLQTLAQGGVDHVALEASSHGLDQRRLDGVRPKAAVFTNLSQDHLDYHGDMDSYFAAKARLFRVVLPADGTAILHAADSRTATLAVHCRGRGQSVLTYGTGGRDLRLMAARPTPTGQTLVVDGVLGARTIALPLVGVFQAQNALGAALAAVATGVAAEDAVAALEALTGVAGRIESVATTPSGGVVYVDYAHTPDALINVLTALRPHAQGRLKVVFGCGGDRDAAKRPLMGAAVARHADVGYLTDDNPRTEDPVSIRAAAKAACPDAVEIGDRADAIAAAVADLSAGDILVIAGKGHETGQEIGTEILPFDDAAVARAAVADLAGGAS